MLVQLADSHVTTNTLHAKAKSSNFGTSLEEKMLHFLLRCIGTDAKLTDGL